MSLKEDDSREEGGEEGKVGIMWVPGVDLHSPSGAFLPLSGLPHQYLCPRGKSQRIIWRILPVISPEYNVSVMYK